METCLGSWWLTTRAASTSSGWITATSARSKRSDLMPQASLEEVGRELSDLAFGIVEQNWLEQHVGKTVDLKSLDQLRLNVAEWEFTYLILFAITNGCGSFSAVDSARTTAILKAFHSTVLSHIAEQAGQDV